MQIDIIEFTQVKYIGKFLIPKDNICARPWNEYIIVAFFKSILNIIGIIKNDIILICDVMFTSYNFITNDNTIEIKIAKHSFQDKYNFPLQAQRNNQYITKDVNPEQI